MLSDVCVHCSDCSVVSSSTCCWRRENRRASLPYRSMFQCRCRRRRRRRLSPAFTCSLFTLHHHTARCRPAAHRYWCWPQLTERKTDESITRVGRPVGHAVCWCCICPQCLCHLPLSIIVWFQLCCSVSAISFQLIFLNNIFPNKSATVVKVGVVQQVISLAWGQCIQFTSVLWHCHLGIRSMLIIPSGSVLEQVEDENQLWFTLIMVVKAVYEGSSKSP